MKLKRFLAGLLAVMLLAVQPIQIVQADEEINTEQGAAAAAEEKTAEQIAEEEKAKLEAEKKASLEIPPDTNLLESWPAGPAVYARSAIVMDMGSKAILYAKKPDEQHFPASITKLLTTLVALETSSLTDQVLFSQESVDFLNWDDANIGMRPGEVISMKDALYAVLLASANEVSYAVAENIGQTHLNGGYDTFIQRMNERAIELGCTGSNWVNPNGLHDENHYTTAHDMALITSAVYQEETFREIMNTLEYRIPPTNLEEEERVFQQNHRMLWEENFYYYPYCTGGKTGFTDQAMTTLVTTADNGEMQLAAVVLYDYGADAYTDTQAIMDYTFQNFEKIPVSALEKPDEISSFLNEDAYVVLPNGADTSQIECTVTPDDTLTNGTAVYTYHGQTIGSTDITIDPNAFQQEEKPAVVEKDSGNTVIEDPKSAETKEFKKAAAAITVGIAAILLIFFIGYRKYKKQHRR